MNRKAPERELDTALALENGLRYLRRKGYEPELKKITDGYIWSAFLEETDASGYPIHGYGKGTDNLESQTSAVFETIEHLSYNHYQSEAYSRGELQSQSIQTYLESLPDPFLLGNLKDILSEQPDRHIVTARFKALGGDASVDLPLALINPNYTTHIIQGNTRVALSDTFDYTKLRKYASDNGTAAGSSLNEALIHSLSEAVERQCIGDFLVHAVAKRNPEKLKRVDPDSLPPDLQTLYQTICQSLEAEVQLFELTNEIDLPVYMAYRDHPEKNLRIYGSGASHYPAYALKRALTELLQQVRCIAWGERERGEDSLQQRVEEMFRVFDQSPLFRKFSYRNLHELIKAKKYTSIPFSNTPTAAARDLDTHLHSLLNQIAKTGQRAYYRIFNDQSDAFNLICAQVLLTPFDGNFLFAYGIPVGFSHRSLRMLRPS